MPRKTGYFWLAALLGGWAVDFLFWGHTPGISILLWVGWILLLGIGLGVVEGIRPSRINIIVVVLAPQQLLDFLPHPGLPGSHPAAYCGLVCWRLALEEIIFRGS
jgi:hypothetical protein